MIFLAILSGEPGIRGVAEPRWRLGRPFKLKNRRVPSDGPVRRLLALVTVNDLGQCLGQWAEEIGQTWRGADGPGISPDGKREGSRCVR
jgi:hypothetical protein